MKRLFLAAFFVLTIAGCATKPQGPLAFNEKAMDARQNAVGIAIGPLPKVQVNYPGADCLLCIGVAMAMNSSLEKHAEQLEAEDLKSLKAEIEKIFANRGFKTVALPVETLTKKYPKKDPQVDDHAKSDYSELKGEHKVDKVVLISINRIGFDRRFANYFPTSPPFAVAKGNVSLIDLNTNRYLAYKDIDLTVASKGEWDEPVKFPGLTSAYYEAIERFRVETVKTFE